MITLEEIIEHKKHKLERAQENLPLHEIEKMAAPVKSRNFKGAISKGTGVNLIAELKKASPSHGAIRENYNPEEIAKIYKKSGAAALSVLTEDKYFQGSIEHLKKAKEAADLSVLRKDFIISDYQIYESAIAGYDAILLIAAALDKGLLRGLYNEAKSLGMDVVVEVHNERELEKALMTGAEIIGINNRNLRTLEVDINTTIELFPKIPPEKIVVSESGIREREDVKMLSDIGVKAVLVGTVFMEADDICSEVKRIMGW